MKTSTKLLLFLGLSLTAGVVVYVVVPKSAKPKQLNDFERMLADKANQALTWSDYDGHCTGYVGSIFRSLGYTISGTVRTIAAKAQQIGAWHRNTIPRVGDLIFFDNTYDSNRDGQYNDLLTHIAIVLAVDPDGTITFGHGGTGRGRVVETMNLKRPDVYKDENGRVINAYLRARKSGDSSQVKYLAGQLWAGFATVRPEQASAWT